MDPVRDSVTAYDRLFSRAVLVDAQVEEALVLRPAAGEPVHVKAQARRFLSPAGMVVRFTMMDLSTLKLVQDELARSLETFFRYWRP